MSSQKTLQTHRESTWNRNDHDLLPLPFVGIQWNGWFVLRVTTDIPCSLEFFLTDSTCKLGGWSDVEAAHLLLTPAETDLLLELFSPRNVGKYSMWEDIVNFDGGHGYLQERWIINLPSELESL
jgi:hypothetical protein